MKAEFQSLVSATKGKWKGFDFTYKGEAYKGQEKDPITRFVFANAKFLPVLKDCAVGDWLELSFVKNGQYTNLDDAVKISAPVAASVPAKEYKGRQEDPDTQLRIARAVALKAAVDYTVSLTAKDKSLEAVMDTAELFEKYLTLQDADSLMTTVDCDTNPFEEEN